MGNIYFITQPTQEQLLAAERGLEKTAYELNQVCITDKADIKERCYVHYDNIVKYKKIRSSMMDNIRCDEPCCSYIHEELKKLYFLENEFKQFHRTIIGSVYNPEDLRRMRNLCDFHISVNSNKDFASIRAYELEMIEFFEHKEEIKQLAYKLSAYALYESYDIEENTSRRKTAESKQAFEQDPARFLLGTRKTLSGDSYYVEPRYTSEYPAYVYLKQMLEFAEKYPGVIPLERVFELQKYMKKYDAYDARARKFAATDFDAEMRAFERQQRHTQWAREIIDKLSGRNPWELHNYDIKQLREIARMDVDEYGYTNVTTAQEILHDYDHWLRHREI